MIASLVAGRLRAMMLRLRGAKIGPKTSVGARLRIRGAQWVQIGSRVVIEHDVYLKVAGGASLRIGDYTYLGHGCTIHVAQSVTIGAHALIGDYVVIADHTHDRARSARLDEQGIRSAPVILGDDVLVNPGVVIIAGVTIGNGAVVGAGAVVTHDVAPYAIVAGVPARVVGTRA